MISLLSVAGCGALALLLWSMVGLAVAPRLLPRHAVAAAPALGYALFHAASLPLFTVIGVGPARTGLVLALTLLAAGWACRQAPCGVWRRAEPQVPALALVLAGLLALVPALAVLPKPSVDGTVFAIQIFDHAKAAIIDEVRNNSLPPVNPFYGPVGDAAPLAYYYLWHVAAALFASVLGASGWEADAGLTFATAAASLGLMMAMAVRWSGRRGSAYWVLLLSAAVSLRPVLSRTVWGDDFGDWITGYPGLQAWLVQASWVPQHLAAADCLCLTLLLLAGLGRPAPARGDGALLALGLGLSVTAGFASSSYIGGVLLALALPALTLVAVLSLDPASRRRWLGRAALAAALTLLLILPLVRDQIAATAARHLGLPIGLSLFEVWGRRVPPGLAAVLQGPGFWLVQLPVDLPAIYLSGLAGLWACRRASAQPAHRLEQGLFAVLSLVGLLAAWLLVSTIANNDLGWRALLPAVMGLTLFAAVWLAGQTRLRPLVAMTLLPLGLGLVGGGIYLRENGQGDPLRFSPDFAASAAVWQRVRQLSRPDERVANNPAATASATAWPVNLSWALLAQRRSCFAGGELALAYVALPRPALEQLSRLFAAVFAGTADDAAVDSLARVYDCRLVIVTPADGAWRQDPFARSPRYRLVDELAGRWRIYRAALP